MKPLQFLTQIEWLAWRKRNRAMREAWDTYAPFMRLRTKRGVTRWVFEWGWAAAERHYARLLSDMDKLVQTRIAKLEEDFIKEWEKRTKQTYLDQP